MARRGLLQPLAHRDFALLWSGQTISLVGDGIFTVALPLQTLALTSRPTALATVIATRALPRVLFLLVAGAIADRLPRRRIALVSDAVRGLAVGVIAILAATHRLEVWHLVTMATVFGIADAFFFPTMTAIVPEILPQELLVAGSGLSATSQKVAESLIGPALGGLLVGTIGTAWSFGLDAATFGLSAACIMAMRLRATGRVGGSSILADAREGFRFTRSQPWLWWSLLAAGIANFLAFAPMSVLMPLVLRGALHASSIQLGLVFASMGAGGVGAAILAGLRGSPRRRITAMWTGWALGSVFVLGTALAPSVAAAGVTAFLTGFGLEYGNVLWAPLMQTFVPGHLLGRVSALDWLFSLALTPIGVAVAGPIAEAVGSRPTMAVGGALAACCGLVLFLPGVRDPERQIA